MAKGRTGGSPNFLTSEFLLPPLHLSFCFDLWCQISKDPLGFILPLSPVPDEQGSLEPLQFK
jgi:hypothetical protein